MRFNASLVAAITVLSVCAVFLVSPDIVTGLVAHAHAAVSDHGYSAAAVVLATGLDNLRAQHSDIKTRAAAKIAEIVDGIEPTAARAIETEHGEMLRDLSTVADAITAEERRLAAPPAPAAVVPDLAAERTRTAEIVELSTRHAMPADFATRHIAGGTALDEVRRIVLAEVATRSATVSGRVQVIADEGDALRSGVESAILLRANPRAINADTEAGRASIEQARAWRGMSLLEIGRDFVEQSTGERVRGLSKMGLATRLLNLDTGMRSGSGMSTSDFPAILANVVSKRLRNAYEVAPQNWKKLGRQSNAPDFKSKAVTQLSNLPTLKAIKEGGEYQYAGLSDGQEIYALGTYGRIVNITRQTLINDDLGAFDRLPMLLGRAAAETEASIFWAVVTGNPAMSDGNAIFHASHGNLGTAGAIAIASLNEARANMRKQKGLAKKAADAEPLNLTPAYLVVSPDKETEAQQFLATTLYPSQNSVVNPFAGSMTQITEARLTGNAWYVFADPATIDTIEYAYLEGEEGLYTEQRLGFEVDGLEIKGRLDFAAKAIDWRGMHKNAGN